MQAGKPKRRRWWWVLAPATLLAWLVGCTSTVTPPAQVGNPTAVLLIRDAMHRGLLLPNDEGFVEFGFGDWGWYALGNDA